MSQSPVSYSQPPGAALRCARCGTPVTKAAAMFCPSCGAPLKQQVPPRARRKTGGWSFLFLLLLAIIVVMMGIGFARRHLSMSVVASNPESVSVQENPSASPAVTPQHDAPMLGQWPTQTATPTLPSDISRLSLFGNTRGDEFLRFDPQRRPVIGFQIQTDWENGHAVLRDIIPLYDPNSADQDSKTTMTVMANDGYAVGGMYIVGHGAPQAIAIIFSPIEKTGVATTGGYTSEWYGETDGSRPTLIESRGRFVLGVYGAHEQALSGIGLLVSAGFEP